jgi:hypothetical protein
VPAAERYVTLERVREALPQVRLDATSKPNEGQVLRFIEAVSDYTDAALRGIGYAVPVVAAEALPVLQEIVLHGVIAKTLRSTNLGVRDPEASGAGAEQKAFERMFEKLLDPRDPLTLPGVVQEKSGAYAGLTESQVRGLDLDPDIEPAFVRGQVF